MAKWKQPVCFDFDTTKTKELLFEIICQVEKSGFQVLAIAFNLGSKTLISQMKLSPKKYWFPNPANPSCKVYAFADVPHLLEFLRNHLLDKG